MKTIQKSRILIPIWELLKTEERRNPLEYGKAKVKLPIGSAEPGDYDPSRTPYLNGPAEAFHNPKYSRLVNVFATQMSKTLFLFLCMMYRIDESPSPCLYFTPGRKLSEEKSGEFSTILKENKGLYRKLQKGQRDKITEKYFGGVAVRFGWASSAKELCSHEAGLVVMDERDRMANNIDNEGDPVDLVEARTATYPDSKVIVTSTPTREGSSAIWKLFEEGTAQKWYLPCPDCKEYFLPTLSIFKWAITKEQDQVTNAWIECPHCKFEIENQHKNDMNKKGLYVSPDQRIENGEVVGELKDNKTASFWVSGLCSPWRTYKEAADSFVTAERSDDYARIQVSVNTVFGELFKMRGEKPEEHQLEDLKTTIPSGILPAKILAITCGIDVQKDSIYYAVRAWSYRGESYTIEYGQLFALSQHGTDDDQIYIDIEEQILDLVWDLPDMKGYTAKIKLLGIDSGYRTHNVYNFCRKNPEIRKPFKGQKEQSAPIKTSYQQVNYKGQHLPGGIKLFNHHTFYFKKLLYKKIRCGNNTGAGMWHLPYNIEDEYCAQILSEELVTMASGGEVFIKTGENHYLDCEVINEACGEILGANEWREKD